MKKCEPLKEGQKRRGGMKRRKKKLEGVRRLLFGKEKARPRKRQHLKSVRQGVEGEGG